MDTPKQETKHLFLDQDHHLNPTLPMKEYDDKPLAPEFVKLGFKREPKPPTGEWTARREDESWTSRWYIETGSGRIWFNHADTAKAIAAAHNAAIAAEEKKNIALHYRLDDLEQQLAAEKEISSEALRVWEKESKQLREQLDDEKGKVENLHGILGKKRTEIKQLQQQLAAEKERSKELREDLEHYAEVIEKREKQLAAEKEVGGNTAIALAQQITKLEDQLTAAVEALEKVQQCNTKEKSGFVAATAIAAIKRMQGAAMDEDFTQVQKIGDDALAKIGDQ